MKKPPEMSERQFQESLKRNGFKHEFWGWFSDATGQCPNIKFGGVFYRNGKCARRATIAYLKKRRDEEADREAKRRADVVAAIEDKAAGAPARPQVRREVA